MLPLTVENVMLRHSRTVIYEPLNSLIGYFVLTGGVINRVRDNYVLPAGVHVFSNRSVKQREDILTNKLAANTHVIARKTQIAHCAAVNNWGDTWNIIRWWAIMF